MKAFIDRVRFALQGWLAFFGKETNGQIQLCVAIATIAAGFWLQIDKAGWIAVLGCIAMVLALEMVNSAVEKLCDLLHPERHPGVKFIKDVAAGSVLWASVLAAIIGLVVFIPKLLDLL